MPTGLGEAKAWLSTGEAEHVMDRNGSEADGSACYGCVDVDAVLDEEGRIH